jgi:F0F1-type ATP synthase assembly protein I
MPEESNTSGLGHAYRKAGPYLGLGIEYTATILLCFVLGRWIDGKLETSPILTLAGFLLGMTAATMNLLRTVNRLHAKAKRPAESEEEGT